MKGSVNINYAQIRKMDISNGEGIGVALFVQGCHFHCKNCFNSETWDFSKGKPWTTKVRDKFLALIDNPHVSRVSILGGEPLAKENVTSIFLLVAKIREKYPDKKIWLYTGYTWEHILNSSKTSNESLMRKDIVHYCDYVVDGLYVDELKDYTLKYRGSSNQRVINVKKTIKHGKVVTEC